MLMKQAGVRKGAATQNGTTYFAPRRGGDDGSFGPAAKREERAHNCLVPGVDTTEERGQAPQQAPDERRPSCGRTGCALVVVVLCFTPGRLR